MRYCDNYETNFCRAASLIYPSLINGCGRLQMASCRFSTLKTFSGHLEDIVSHKNTQYQNVCVYLNLFVYISRDFSSLVAIEMYGRPFCFGATLHREYYRTL